MNRRLHIAWITSLFVVTTVAAFVITASDIMDGVISFTSLKTQDPSHFLSYGVYDPAKTGIIVVTYIGYVLANCIADSVLLHRLYTIWGSRKRIVAFPLLASVVANAIGLATAIMKIISSDMRKAENFAIYQKAIQYQIGYFASNAAVNSLITLMIATRIWWVARDTRRAISGHSQSNDIDPEYKTIIRMILESGSIYPAFLIVHAVLTGHASKVGVTVNLLPAVILISGIAPTLIILRSNLTRTVEERKPREKSSTLHFELSSVVKSDIESPTSPIDMPRLGVSQLGQSDTMFSHVGSDAEPQKR
ncbi:hypothetical protein VNI00_006824 [Paramarasmius palmivorus]|uniref:Uncharacterized protein n=1 Tax=Paramarasmius palmivorus TaxID=297713 RepID=A0AAW0D875_9AGAR